jgi:hypothetical protein
MTAPGICPADQYWKHAMNRFFVAGAAVLAMTASAAMAQTTSSQTTTTVTPAIVAPPAGTLSSTHTEKTTGVDGTKTESTATTYRNTNGVADDSVTKTTTYPSSVITTEKSSTSSVTK